MRDQSSGRIYFLLVRDNKVDAAAHVDLFLNDFDPAVVVGTWDAEVVFLTPGT
jgi:hypothetical protein